MLNVAQSGRKIQLSREYGSVNSMYGMVQRIPQNIVEQAGYTNCVYYKVNPNNNTAYEDGRDSEALYFTAPEPADKSDCYAFSANKDGEKYGVLVSYFRGTIDEEQKQGV